MNAVRARLGITGPVLTGVIVFVLLIGVVVFVFGGVLFRTFGPEGRTVTAVFRDTVELNPKRAEVRVDGIKVGKVKDVTVNRGGRSATVEMEVFDDGFPLYKDASAAVRWRNALGGTTIVDLDRGSASAGELSPRVIPLHRTTSQVELDPLISVFRNDAKRGLQTMMAEVPRALADRDGVSNALRNLADVAPSVGRAAAAVRGEQDGDLRNLVKNTAATVKALDVPRDLRTVIEGAATTLETTARREADVRATIAGVARVEPQVVETLSRVDSTLSIADPVVAQLRKSADDVAPTAAELRPVLAKADRLLEDARPLLSSLRPAATSLAQAARVGLPFLRNVEPTIKRVDEKVLPGMEDPDPVTKLTASQSLGPFLSAFNGLAAHFDNRGYYVRFPASGGERAIAGTGCKPFFTDPESTTYLKCQTLTRSIENFFKWRPLPPPEGSR